MQQQREVVTKKFNWKMHRLENGKAIRNVEWQGARKRKSSVRREIDDMKKRNLPVTLALVRGKLKNL